MMRELSTATILFHQAVADRLGMNITDHKCAGILAERADHGRGTGGAHRSDHGCHYGRDRPPGKGGIRASGARRRRPAGVIVEPDCDAIARKIGPIFESMGREAVRVYSGYSVERK